MQALILEKRLLNSERESIVLFLSSALVEIKQRLAVVEVNPAAALGAGTGLHALCCRDPNVCIRLSAALYTGGSMADTLSILE